MTHPDRSKLVLPAVVVGCALTAGFAWRVIGSKPTDATIGVDVVASDVSVVERDTHRLPHEATELVGVVAMETLLERQASSAREKAERERVGPADPEGAAEPDAGSMEFVIQLPPKDEVEGVLLRVVLDEPTGGKAPRDWTGEVELPKGARSALIENLPAATSFRLRVFQGQDLYASTTVKASGIGRTTIEIDFVLKFEQEEAAISALRSIAAAQQQLRASSAIDTDADGRGEFGYFGELAGTQPIRHYAPGGATLDPNGVKLDPTFLPASMGELEVSSEGGVMVREGYAFLMYLPDSATSAPFGGIAESLHGGNAPTLPGSDNAETMWCCYAWPVEATTPMKQAFMIHQAGVVHGTPNEGPRPYVGFSSVPAFDAAFSVPGDMGSEPALASLGLLSTDRRVWSPTGI